MIGITDRSGRTVLALTGTRIAVVAAVAVATVVLVETGLRAAPGFPAWPALLLVLLVAAALALPDSAGGLLVLAVYGGWWAVAVDEPSLGAATVAAIAGLVLHVALAHAAAGPGDAITERGVGLEVLGQTVLVAAATVAVAAVVAGVEGSFRTPVLGVATTLALLGVLPFLAGGRR